MKLKNVTQFQTTSESNLNWVIQCIVIIICIKKLRTYGA